MSIYYVRSTDYLARTVIEETESIELLDAAGNKIKFVKKPQSIGFIRWEKKNDE